MARGHLELFYPLRSITMTTADPHFLTPTVKHLLRKKNRLMRAGRTEEASAYARRVGRCIELATRAHLRDIDPRHGLEDMWRRVGELTNRQRTQDADIGISAAELNDHYAKISSDNQYLPPPLRRATAYDNRPLSLRCGPSIFWTGFVTQLTGRMGSPHGS